MVGRLIPGIRGAAGAVATFTDSTINQTVIRVAVTGLSRAGKTVFITSLINNLIALGRGYNTLPCIQKVLAGSRGSRLRNIRVVPAGFETISYFDYASKLAELAGEQPAWPPRTDHLAQIALDLEIERESPVWSKLGRRRVRLELLDYPGEWLLDLPLLSRSYGQWSSETLALMRTPSRKAACAPFLEFLSGVRAGDVADESLLRHGHELYVAALHECRAKLGLRYLQPGRFLCPGPNGQAPYLWFFPLDEISGNLRTNTVAALLCNRFDAYKAQIRSDFFDSYFSAFNRQIILVDVLSALHAGRTAFEDTSRAIADIAKCMVYADERSSGLIQMAGNAAIRASKAALRSGTERRIERVVFAATKSDHVPTLSRQNLANLLRAMVQRAGGDRLFNGRLGGVHTVSGVYSTCDAVVEIDSRPVAVVRGQLCGEQRQRDFHPGDVPSGWPPEEFWGHPFFELPCFNPPHIDSSKELGIPHLGVDEVIADLLKDVL